MIEREEIERKAFEAAEGATWKGDPKESVFKCSENGAYELYSVEERWQGWKLRASAPTISALPQNIRAKFEELGRSLDWDLMRCNHGYSDCNVDYAWIGYMAALRDQMAAATSTTGHDA